jgi:threonine/homoserine/homoserine lactone efflux protein
MTLMAIVIFAGALIADSLSPGPTVAALVARVLSRGVGGVIPFMIAIWLGEAIWLSAAVAGLSALADTFSRLFEIIKWIGVAYLFYFAWTVYTSKPEIDEVDIPVKNNIIATFLSGLSVSIGNPKNMIFYLTLLPSIVDMRGVTMMGWLQLVITLLSTLIAVDLCWVILATKARQILRNSRAVRRINQISGGAMAVAATVLAIR